MSRKKRKREACESDLLRDLATVARDSDKEIVKVIAKRIFKQYHREKKR